MRCHRPNTDQEAYVSIFAGDTLCPEFILPSRQISDPNVLECFIPISDGDQITVEGAFRGSILHGAFDLLADGSFLRDSRNEGGINERKWVSRKIKFQEVLTTRIEEERGTGQRTEHAAEGTLHVKPLVTSPVVGLGTELGVGSLAIVISVNEETRDQYRTNYEDSSCGYWRTRDPAAASNGGIAPTHELEVKVLDEDVNKNRKTKHKRHLEQLRFGLKPWAVFIFHYRSHMAIQSAGCIARPSNASHELEPYDGDNFKLCDQEFRGGKKKKMPMQQEQEQELTRFEEDEDEDGIVVAGMHDTSPSPSPPVPMPPQGTRTRGNGMFMTPPPAESVTKPKLFGLSLFDQSVFGKSQVQPPEDASTSKVQTQGGEPGTARDRRSLAAEKIQPKIPDRSTAAQKSSTSGIAEGNSSWMKSLGQPPPSKAQHQLTARMPNPTRPAAVPKVTPIPVDHTIAISMEDTTDEPPQSDTPLRPNFDNAELEIKQESVSPGPENFGFSDAAHAVESEIQPHTADEQRSSHPAARDVRGGQNNQDPATNAESLALSIDIVSAKARTPSSNTSQTRMTPSSSGVKRISSFSLSREGTPSKKRHMTPGRARKEELLASLEKKRQLKLAAEKGFQEIRKRREEEERRLEQAEAREIEMLEKANAEEEEELAALTRAREQEEIALEEMRQEREEFEDAMKD